MKVLVIDNYDSFIYNVIHILKELGVETIDIIKNDKIELEQIDQYDKIILSPGPGIPSEAGKLMDVIAYAADHKDILGICLGHQAIGEYYGHQLKRLETPLHGISSPMQLAAPDELFQSIPDHSPIAHYHSWVIEESNSELAITAYDEQQHIMAVKHRTLNVRGVQFHPESILTTYGKEIIKNWIKN
ncbi:MULTISPECIES: anthranilate synthase component II [Myroides]|uniref:anthranilate synthase component II n=1 Tax=Myroides TaxID=76831 RepID=UPI00046873EA|nr:MULTISPECIES: aminodeoxychorismate/anthranilate synthase component II [Myroides]MCA4791518.1 aminodeoxychorismate/anthranilate synthase component II [Myroides odoratimimus]MCA4818778.1 aminodeoxychorismate/anthranilate synthase component II [Myroides odoratimimus]MDM1058708.1 aminodeoxychorismate/anthranilate synthase component II [Myroides odoratimimus]MDM1092412.1 aminodeoxychorismate/anthranilate synthase component II [Myroides odoratimimus]MDM1096032.1 aminodeoxychorismate/anthranilate 